MIKINLIGEDSVASSDNVMWLAAYAGSAALLVVVFVFLQFQIAGSISELDAKRAATETSLARLKEKTKEVREGKNFQMEFVSEGKQGTFFPQSQHLSVSKVNGLGPKAGLRIVK